MQTNQNQGGFTLVELLAAITLASLVIVLLGTIHLFAQKQYQVQTESVNHQKEVRLAMTSVTQQLRSVTSDQVSFDGSTLTVGDCVYYWDQNSQNISLDGTILAREIAQFDIQKSAEYITVTIQSEENNQGKIADLSSTIYFRE